MNQPLNVTQQEALAAMRSYVEAQSNIDKIAAQMRLEKAEIEAKYADKIVTLEQQRDALQRKVEVFATANRASLLTGDAKSTSFGAGKIGWKASPPKLVARNWDELREYLQRAQPHLIRTIEEVDKKALLDEAKTWKPKDLEKVGLSIESEESFFIKF